MRLWGIDGLGGILGTAQREGRLLLLLDGAYVVPNEELVLPAQTLGLRKVIFGLRLHHKIISELKIQLEYNHIIPIVDYSINWSSYHRLKLGLQHSF